MIYKNSNKTEIMQVSIFRGEEEISTSFIDPDHSVEINDDRFKEMPLSEVRIVFTSMNKEGE